MKLAVFENHGGASWGRVTDDGSTLVDLSAWRPHLGAGLIAGLPEIMRARGKECHVSDIVRWRVPIARENRIFCVGVNYGAHALESGRDVPQWPSVFLRHADSFVGHETEIVKPAASDEYDYEAELGVVIGKAGRAINEQDAMSYIAGFTCIAENSVRDFQRHSRQVTAGKNFDHSGAIGPFVVTSDEIDDFETLEVRGILNGEEMQRGGVADLIYSIPKLISYISAFTALQPGDIISTGTPEGVGASRQPPRFLKPGDVFEVSIEGIGTLRNSVTEEIHQ